MTEPFPIRIRKSGEMADLVEEFWDLELIEALFHTASRCSPEDFRDAFHQRFDRQGRLILTGSAREGLQAVLRTAAGRSSRRRVLLSSFNCRLVRDAVVHAGLSADTFDFATLTGEIDWEEVGRSLTNEHLAVVIPHLFGIPTDFTLLLPFARRKNVWIVEDCAHALGATIAGTQAGLMGDAAVFSFNYDKPISLAGGGAILIHRSAADFDVNYIEESPPARLELRQFRQLASTLRYGRTRRGRPTLMARLGSRLHLTPYSAPRLPVGIGPLRAAAGIWQLERYDEVRERRDYL